MQLTQLTSTAQSQTTSNTATAKKASKVNCAAKIAVAPKPEYHSDMTEEEILANITAIARDHFKSDTDLRSMVMEACKSDLERDEVIDAIVAGGWSESWARSLVSSVWVEAGKRANKAGQGRKSTNYYTAEAIVAAKHARQHFGDGSIKALKYAIKILEREGSKVLALDAAA